MTVLVMGAFAVTYKEFSLTTIAAVLTVIGYSMNDTIVVFDRIRENASRLRDKKFPQIVNISINETLSRTILTSATVFFVTLAMNIWGTGTIRDFAFAMNVGVIVGTYSSIFVASPVLIWLNEKSVAMQKKSASRTGRPARSGKVNLSPSAPMGRLNANSNVSHNPKCRRDPIDGAATGIVTPDPCQELVVRALGGRRCSAWPPPVL